MPKCARCGKEYDPAFDGCPNCSASRGLPDFLNSCGLWLVWVVVVLIGACALVSSCS